MGDVMRRGPWPPLTEAQTVDVDAVKRMGNELHDYLESLPACREVSLAKTKLEEAIMWAVKGITAEREAEERI